MENNPQIIAAGVLIVAGALTALVSGVLTVINDTGGPPGWLIPVAGLSILVGLALLLLGRQKKS
jgi:hypothetical protein